MRLLPVALRAALVVGIGLAMPLMAEAEGLKLSGSKKNRALLFKSQTALLDGRLSKQYDGSKRLRPNYKKEEAVSYTHLDVYKRQPCG